MKINANDKYDVFLDGKPVKYVKEADSDDGYVICYSVTNGVLDTYNGHEVVLYKRGRVEIQRKCGCMICKAWSFLKGL